MCVSVYMLLGLENPETELQRLATTGLEGPLRMVSVEVYGNMERPWMPERTTALLSEISPLWGLVSVTFC